MIMIAATDIAGVVNEAALLKDGAMILGIAIVLWLCGRRLLKILADGYGRD